MGKGRLSQEKNIIKGETQSDKIVLCYTVDGQNPDIILVLWKFPKSWWSSPLVD